MAKRDYYKILEVNNGATAAEIKRAYRKRAKELHPDINKDEDAEERFKEVSEAYTVLSDEQKRAAYDRFGHAGVSGNTGGFNPGDFSGFEDIFDQFMSGFGGSSRSRVRNAPRRGNDLRYRLRIEFEEAVQGAQREIEIERDEICPRCHGNKAEPNTPIQRCTTCNGRGEVRQVRQTFLGQMVNVTTCPSCRGTGDTITKPCTRCYGHGAIRKKRRLTVSIPAGVDNGTQIRLSGEGEPGHNGGPAGNLYVLLEVQKHRFFRRRRNDIVLELDVSVAQAVLGAYVSVPTVEGEEEIDIPAGTQPGTTIRLRNKGVPHLKRSGRGDQIVVINVTIPKHLSTEQRELFAKLAESFGDEPPKPKATSKSFFDNLRDLFGME